MFVVTEADAAAIRATYEVEVELSAAIELRQRFPGIGDNARARECARSIAAWKPMVNPPATVTPLRPRKRVQVADRILSISSAALAPQPGLRDRNSGRNFS